MQGIKGGLEAQEGIQDVSVEPLTGSVTIKYDHQRHETSGILGFLEDLDVVVRSIENLPTVGGGEGRNRLGPGGFLAAVEDLNQRLYGATGIPIDLKIALPVAFACAGILAIGAEELILETVPGLLLLWLAFDMFVKLHPSHPGTAGAAPPHWLSAAEACTGC
jgi:hypothetical protein